MEYLTDQENKYYSKLKDTSFNNLVVSSGGMNGIICVGALNFLHSIKKLDTINNYIGCSAGSIITLMLLIGYNPFEINQILMDINAKEDFMNIDVFRLIKEFGIFDNNIIKKTFEKIITDKLGFIPTMKELYEITNKTWTAVIVNYNDINVVYANYKTHPDELCSDIAAASCCIPIIFTPIKIKSSLCVDGGIFDPFPVGYTNDNLEGNTLGVVLLDKKQQNLNIFNFITKLLFFTTTIKKNKVYEYYVSCPRTCIINLTYVDRGLNFNLTSTEKAIMFNEGDIQIRKKYKIHSTNSNITITND
jgi:predicted acylesterase/phospholipase RssA